MSMVAGSVLLVWSVLGASGARLTPQAVEIDRGSHAAGIDQSAVVDSINALFGRYSIVGFGEIHRSAPVHAILKRLVSSRAFRDTVDDIVVEFGNARYQPLMNRYVNGEPVPADSLRLVWRNTTQVLVWDSPLYEDFFRTIRTLNQSAGARKLRVLLGDPPIDWAQVKTTADFPRGYGYRDPDTFRILEQEVLARGRKALVVIGSAHLIRRDPMFDFAPGDLAKAGLGDALDQKYPGRSFMIWSVDDSSERLRPYLGRWAPGTLARVGGTDVGRLTSAALFGSAITIFRMRDGKRVPVQLSDSEFPPIQNQVDALLYVGRAEPKVLANPATYADAAYVAELRRRNKILGPVFGIDIEGQLDTLVAQARGKH